MTYRLHLIWTLLTFPTSLYALPHSPQREILSCMWLIRLLVLSECLSSWRFWGDSAVRLSNTAGSWGYVSREIACLLQQAHSVFWDSPALLPVRLAAEEQHMANQKLDSSTDPLKTPHSLSPQPGFWGICLCQVLNPLTNFYSILLWIQKQSLT